MGSPVQEHAGCQTHVHTRIRHCVATKRTVASQDARRCLLHALSSFAACRSSSGCQNLRRSKPGNFRTPLSAHPQPSSPRHHTVTAISHAVIAAWLLKRAEKGKTGQYCHENRKKASNRVLTNLEVEHPWYHPPHA